MEIAKSDIVRSDAGRDQGKLFVVLAVEGEYLLLADGKGRKAESPKRKKRKHVLFVAEDDSRLADKIKRSEKITNRPTAGKSNRTRRDNVWQNPT